MTTHNKSELLVKKCFWFLVENHGFEYFDLYSFQSEKMIIQILPGHKTPRIEINKIGGSGLYKLDFEWIIRYFHKTFPSENHDYLKHNLKTNMIFISKIFRENSHRLINEFDEWWIPVHIFYYRTVEEGYRNKGQINIFKSAYKYYYDYLKSQNAI